MKLRFCEFTGDDKYDWDEVGHKRLCKYAGFSRCTLHTKSLGEYQGWRVCCDECNIPVQIKYVDALGN